MENLSNESLFEIFRNLDIIDIPNVSQVCTKFNYILNTDYYWNDKLRNIQDDLSFLNNEINRPIDICKIYVALNKIKREFHLDCSLDELYFSEEIRLPGRNITKIPEQIEYLTNLRELGLWNNQIKFIPKEIGNLYNLQLLSLGDNQIREIPKEIGNLVNLQNLYIWSNQLEEIPKEIGYLTNLQILSLHNNPIGEIPKEIEDNPNITIYK